MALNKERDTSPEIFAFTDERFASRKKTAASLVVEQTTPIGNSNKERRCIMTNCHFMASCGKELEAHVQAHLEEKSNQISQMSSHSSTSSVVIKQNGKTQNGTGKKNCANLLAIGCRCALSVPVFPQPKMNL